MNRMRSFSRQNSALNPHARAQTILARILCVACIALAASGAAAWAAPDGVGEIVTATDGIGFVISLPSPSAMPRIVQRMGEPPAIELAGFPSVPDAGGWQLPSRTVWVGVPLDGDVVATIVPLDREPINFVGQSPVGAPALRLPELSVEIGPAQWIRNQRVVPVMWRPIVESGAAACLERSVRVSLRFTGRTPVARPASSRDEWDAIYFGLLVNYEQARPWRRGPEPTTAPRPPTGDSFWTGNQPWFRIEVTHPGLYAISGEDLQRAGIDITTIDPRTFRLFSGTGLSLPEDKNYTQVPDWLHEIAISRAEAQHATFGPQDRILFHGVGSDGWYGDLGLADKKHEQWRSDEFSNVNTYWLSWEGNFLGSPLEWGAAAAGAAGSIETSAWMRTHFERDLIWDPRPRDIGGPGNYDPDTLPAWQKWFWREFIASTGDPPTTLSLSIPDPVAGAPGKIFARMWGANWSGSVGYHDHYAAIDLGGSRISQAAWDGISHVDLIADPVQFATGDVQLTVRALSQPLESRQDRSYLAWVEIDYRRNLVARGDSLEFWVEPGTVQRTFEVRGLTTDTGIFVLDVSDPVQTMRVQPDFAADGAKWRATWTVLPDVSRPKHFVVASGTAAVHPRMVRTPMPEGGYLRQRTDPIDYIIISNPALLHAAADLRDWRAEHGGLGGTGFRVALVNVQDIYNEFSAGRTDPTAIRSFLAFAYANWNTPLHDPAQSPSYVLYLGDGSYDFRNRIQLASPTAVPTYEGNYDPNLRRGIYSPQFGSDDWFVLIDPQHSPNLFLAAGRLPADNPTSAATMVDKIKRYESGEANDGWRQRFTLVADDICQGLNGDDLGFTHMQQTEELAVQAIPAALEREKVYLYEFGTQCIYDRKPAAAAALRREIDQGTLVVNYTGHGSEGQLADERVLETSSVASMDNADHLFFFLTASCSVGKFDFGGEGLGEALVRQPGGGAIGVFSSTAVAFSSANASLNLEFFKAVWPNRDVLARRTLGQVAVLSKEVLGTNFMMNSRRYPLLGDPAVILSPGRYRLNLHLESRTDSNGVTVAHPNEIRRGAEVVLSGTVEDGGGNVQSGYSGDAEFKIYDSQIVRDPPGSSNLIYDLTGAPIFRGVAHVANGTFDLRFVAPSALRTGDSSVRGPAQVYVSASSSDGTGAIGALPNLSVPEIPPQASEDREGPVIHLSTAAPLDHLPLDTTFHATFDDSSGINITQLIPAGSVVVRVEEGGRFVALEDIASRVTFPQSFQHGEADFNLPAGLEAGHAYHLVLEASDNRDHRSGHALDFTVAGVTQAGLSLNRIYNVPNPARSETTFFVEMTQSAEVRIDVFSANGKIVRRLRPGVMQPNRAVRQGIPWDLRDEDGDRLGNGVYFYKISVLDASGADRDRIERLAVLR